MEFSAADPAGPDLLGDHGLCSAPSGETRPQGMHPSARGEAWHGEDFGWAWHFDGIFWRNLKKVEELDNDEHVVFCL